MKKWEELSMRERAAIIKVGVANGITNLKEIRNKFEEGGPIEQQLREQYPHYTDAQIQLLIRSRQSDKNLSEYKSKSTESSNKDYSKDIELVMGAFIVRSTPWFGRYRNAIDTTLDAMGYTAAGYDVWNYLFGE